LARAVAASALLCSIGGAFAAGIAVASTPAPKAPSQVETCQKGEGTPNWPTVQAANQLDGTLRSNFADTYGGLVLSDCNAVITIYETTVSPQLGAAAAAVAPPGAVRFEVVPNSLAQLETVQRKVEDRWQALEAEGIPIQLFGTYVQLNREEIKVTDVTPEMVKELENEFGASLIHVDSVPPGYISPA
jgi:hypothetical protein